MSTATEKYIPRLKSTYHTAVVPKMMEKFGFKNPMAVPRLVKIVINMGLSEARENIKVVDTATEELGAITGQRPQVRRAKKSISNFKLRQGMPVGLMVTLRRDRMYEFMDRLISVAIPRIRDFRGLDSRGFDGHGNYNLGLNEQHIFMEIDLEKSDKVRGMNISVITTTSKDAEARELLELMGLPFKKAKSNEPSTAAKK